MTTLRPSKPSHLAPQILQDKPLAAEVLVGPRVLTVTLSLPQVAREDLDVFLTRNTVRVRSKKNPTGLNYVIPLPVAVEPERYVLREKNGVLDFVVERASR